MNGPHPSLTELDTPCLVVDRAKVAANAERLKSRLAKLGVPLRLHVKIAKSLEAVEAVVRKKGVRARFPGTR